MRFVIGQFKWRQISKSIIFSAIFLLVTDWLCVFHKPKDWQNTALFLSGHFHYLYPKRWRLYQKKPLNTYNSTATSSHPRFLFCHWLKPEHGILQQKVNSNPASIFNTVTINFERFQVTKQLRKTHRGPAWAALCFLGKRYIDTVDAQFWRFKPFHYLSSMMYRNLPQWVQLVQNYVILNTHAQVRVKNSLGGRPLLLHFPRAHHGKLFRWHLNAWSQLWLWTWWHDWWRMSGFRRIPAGWGSWWHDLFWFHLSMLHPYRLDRQTMSFAARVRKSLLLRNRIFRKPSNWSHCQVGQPCVIMKVHA